MKNIKTFKELNESHEEVNEAKSDYMSRYKKTDIWIKGIKDEDIREKLGQDVYDKLSDILEEVKNDHNITFDSITFKASK